MVFQTEMAPSPSQTYLNAALGTTTSTLSTVIDANHPYFLHPSDHPGLILITVTLNEQNYNQWFRSMKIALSSKLKLGFVDGSYVKPANTSNLCLHWTHCNDIVISWLLNTVSPEIRQSVMYMNVAKDIWDDFAIRFAQTNVPKLFNLRKEIASLRQGNLSISAYFTKFRALNDELEALSVVPRCDCGKCSCAINAKLDVFSKSIKLSQFLMGLGEQYTAIRGHLLLMTPIPSLSVAYSILMQEENQREFGVTSVQTDSIALSVKNHESHSAAGKMGKAITGKRNVTDATIVCEVCHLSGHNKDKCFCVHGYPSWHKLFGKPKPKPKIQSKSSHAYNVISDGSDSVSTAKPTTESAGFTTAQYQQLMTMIQSGFKEMSANANAGASSSSAPGLSNQWTSGNSTYMAGNVLHFVCHTNSKRSLSADM